VVGGDAAAGRDDDGEKIVDGFDAKQQQPVSAKLSILLSPHPRCSLTPQKNPPNLDLFLQIFPDSPSSLIKSPKFLRFPHLLREATINRELPISAPGNELQISYLKAISVHTAYMYAYVLADPELVGQCLALKSMTPMQCFPHCRPARRALHLQGRNHNAVMLLSFLHKTVMEVVSRRPCSNMSTNPSFCLSADGALL
jgi:hypothetical protein